jgi:hypothetical protein
MGYKADFAANSWLLARNSTHQTARGRLIARRKGLVQRFLSSVAAEHLVVRGLCLLTAPAVVSSLHKAVPPGAA